MFHTPAKALPDLNSLLRQVSRTFALSIEQLPSPLDRIITVAYLLFRIADTIEDHPLLPNQRKTELLSLWIDILNNRSDIRMLFDQTADLAPDKHDMAVIRQAESIIHALKNLPEQPQNILVSNVCATSRGMIKWQKKGPFMQTEEDMDDYMHYVAGQVGYLLTDVFCWYSPELNKNHRMLYRLGHEFGLALQTVNIIRGLHSDFERGWVFVPKSFLNRAGLTADSLFTAQNTSNTLALIDHLIEKAKKHLKSGLSYITLLPRKERKIRLFCIWPLLFAVKTLDLTRNNKKALLSEAKISRRQVKTIIAVSSMISFSNMLLKKYYYFLGKKIF